MKRFHVPFFFLAIFLSLAIQLPTQAAIVYSGDLDPANPNDWDSYTNAYIGYTNTIDPGQVEVNGGSNLLSGYAYLGYDSGTSGTVTVTGAGSTWNNSNRLYVGNYGNGTLAITGGGAISNDNGHIGYYSGSTGAVTVDGTGSTWNNSYHLYVGHYGNGTLSITNGGTVSNNDGSIGHESGSTGAVTVDGAGSTWNNDGLSVGYRGSGTLAITNGGTVSSSFEDFIGYYSGSTGIVTVDGAGSTWTRDEWNLYVGFFGSGSLAITNGGTVNLTGNTYVAYREDSTGSIDFGANGGTLTTKSFVASSAQLFGTGTINTNGIVSDYDLVFDSTHGPVQTLTIGGSGQDRNITVNLDMSSSVGDLGVNHGSMTINGIAVNSEYGYVGYHSGSTGIVTVDGAGSAWTNNFELYVGQYGNGTLAITNGGAVSSNNDNSIGKESGSTGVVTVDGTGSTWNSGGYGCLYVGEFGSGTLTITGGGAVNCKNSSIGEESGSTGIVTVNGTGSTWTNESSIVVGGEGSGTLNITGGGTVNNDYSSIGYESGSTGVVTVDGAGSTWNNNRSLMVGYDGSGTLSITNGGTVSNNSDHSFIGYEFGSTGIVTVDGTGSTWTNSDSLYVGYEGSGALNITNGGTVNVADSTYVAFGDNSTGSIDFGANGGTLTTKLVVASSAQLFGTGTINTNGIVSDYDLVFDSTHGLVQTFTIGGSGQDRNITVNLDMSSTIRDLGVNHGSMTINGIAVSSLNGYIGYVSGSTGVVTVDGTGSTWNNSNRLYVGNYGNGTLAITGGGTVNTSYIGAIGYKTGSTGIVTVDGAGSTWTSSSNLFVGDHGNGTLNIINGGTVSNLAGTIGYYYNSNSVVTVDGVGSTWTNSDNLYVSGRGRGTLSITNGGAVSNNTGYIGNLVGAIGVVTVDGAGSTWTNNSDLYVGRYGSGTLSITNGGLVSVAGTLTINSDGLANMSDGGMLALAGDADASLAAFFDLIQGTDAIQWWDPEVSGWNSLTSAVMGDDYTLEYFDTGDLAGYTLLTVTAIEPGLGDINCDGMVDSSDFAIMANNWQAGVSDGQTANWTMGDFNNDHKVDSSDFAVMCNNWQSGVGLSLSNVAVPEPGSVALLLTLVAVGMVGRARKLGR